MRVLITGANGQVGRALLAGAPHSVQVRGLSHADLDISSREAVRAVLREWQPDAIVNAAAYTAVDRAESEPEEAQRVNADAVAGLAREAVASGSRLLHVSTDFVFDGCSAIPYRSDSEPNPVSVYGRTKRAGELAVLQASRDHFVVLRTAWVYASSGRNFLLTILRLLREKGAVRVVADQIGSPTAASTVAAVIWRLIDRPDIAGVHHWTNAGVASWYDFAVAISEEAEIAGLLPAGSRVEPISSAEYPTPARRPAYSVLDRSPLETALRSKPAHWRTALREVVRELQRA